MEGSKTSSPDASGFKYCQGRSQERHWKIASLPWAWWLRAMFGLMAFPFMLGHGNVPRQGFPVGLLVVWDIHRGMKTGYRDQSLLGPYQCEPGPPCPCISILFISIEKDLFHSVENGNLNHRILPYSCQLIYSFSPFPQAVKNPGVRLG